MEIRTTTGALATDMLRIQEVHVIPLSYHHRKQLDQVLYSHQGFLFFLVRSTRLGVLTNSIDLMLVNQTSLIII